VFAAVMFDQLFADGFFHADPHPGNVFVTPVADGSVEQGWTLTFIDFGMMGEVPPSTRRGLRKMLIAAASRDGKGLVDAARDIGVLLPSADTTQLELAMTRLFARFGGLGFAELREVDPREFRAFAEEFQEVVRTLPFQLPDDFLLIIRAMSLTSGVCSALDPRFNLWDSVEPYAQRLIREERGNVVRDLGTRVADTAGTLARLPGRVDALLSRIDEGSLPISDPTLERRVGSLERTIRRAVSALVFGGLLAGGVLLRPDDEVLGTVLLVVAVVPLAQALLPGRRR
jgi:predicted unusual protein kinase regulating ubiquinone biosynthesis (AarF/ABC1/UbiB family)